jgi:GNAT superfamily N-acetyltransferase
LPAYRFCRSDDIALLSDALNACYLVHLEDQDAMSSADFKREIRELNVWSSSCMVASDDRDPIAVVTGAKRERETLIHRIGVRPDSLRRGHARHLLESLSQKLAVLGPARMVAEVPDDLPEARSLFEALGYRAEHRFADFTLRRPLAPPVAVGGVSPATLDDLLRSEALDPSVSRSWERELVTLQNRKDQIRGLAIASDTRVEACALFRDLPNCGPRGRREIVGLGGPVQPAQPEGRTIAARVLLETVLRIACQAGSMSVTIPRVSNDEICWDRLESMGFYRERTYTRVARIPDSNTRR